MLPLIVTSPTKSTIWIQLHKLHLKSNWAYGVKRIDILVFLSTHIDNCNRDNAYSLGIALDTKLIGLERTHRDFISCATAVGDISPDPNIRISDDDDDFLCALDSHLHALYATLEITAEFNKAFNHELPRGFRRQAKKYELFSFDNNPWLKEFYDLRTELTHYNTGRAVRHKGLLEICFKNRQDMETFQNGRNEIELNNIANYWPSLNKMLDKWALHILERLRFEEDVSISEIIKYAEEPIHKIYPISDLCNYSKN